MQLVLGLADKLIFHVLRDVMEYNTIVFDPLPLLIVSHVEVLMLLASLLSCERRLLLHELLDGAGLMGFLIEAPRRQVSLRLCLLVSHGSNVHVQLTEPQYFFELIGLRGLWRIMLRELHFLFEIDLNGRRSVANIILSVPPSPDILND